MDLGNIKLIQVMFKNNIQFSSEKRWPHVNEICFMLRVATKRDVEEL